MKKIDVVLRLITENPGINETDILVAAHREGRKICRNTIKGSITRLIATNRVLRSSGKFSPASFNLIESLALPSTEESGNGTISIPPQSTLPPPFYE